DVTCQVTGRCVSGSVPWSDRVVPGASGVGCGGITVCVMFHLHVGHVRDGRVTVGCLTLLSTPAGSALTVPVALHPPRSLDQAMNDVRHADEHPSRPDGPDA